MKETETRVKSVNVESEKTQVNSVNVESENIERVDSWNQERSEDDLDSFLERRLGESGLNLFELAA